MQKRFTYRKSQRNHNKIKHSSSYILFVVFSSYCWIARKEKSMMCAHAPPIIIVSTLSTVITPILWSILVQEGVYKKCRTSSEAAAVVCCCCCCFFIIYSLVDRKEYVVCDNLLNAIMPGVYPSLKKQQLLAAVPIVVVFFKLMMIWLTGNIFCIQTQCVG